MKILSFGCGVQTVTLAAMSCLGDFEMPDAAIFADTQWEAEATYRYLEQFSKWAAGKGLRILKTSIGNIKFDALNPHKRFASMPLYTETGLLMPSGKKEDGQLRRQCTREYKISPVQQAARKLAGLMPRQRWVGQPLELWLGISRDEVVRMKESRDSWVQNRWPLIEKGMSRGDCIGYLNRHGIEVPPKSACLGCPFHSNTYWRKLKKESPSEWMEVIDFDDAIRKTRVAIKHKVYLHRSLTPLKEANIDEGQTEMFGNECEGFCGT